MDLFAAHASGQPLAIDHPDGGRRVLAEVFHHPQGLVFADIGWPSASWHPFHLVEGAISDAGPPWAVGDAAVFIIGAGDPLFDEWAAWQRLRRGALRGSDRRAAARAARSDGLFVQDVAADDADQ